jgi:hypothetical protein
LQIPAAVRSTVVPGLRLVAILNRDASAVADEARRAGFEARGPYAVTTVTGGQMTASVVSVGGLSFEMAQF